MAAVDFTADCDPGDEQKPRCGRCGSEAVSADHDICSGCWDEFDGYYRLAWDDCNYAEMEEH